MAKFFSYDPNGGGFNFYDTAEEAQEEAQLALDAERDEAIDGWADNVDEICWGEVKQCVIETSRRPVDENDEGIGDFDEMVDYALKDVE